MLKPGGVAFVAGEPTRIGDRLARRAGRLVRGAISLADRARPEPASGAPAPAPGESEDDRVLRDLEFEVDLHTFDPAEVAGWARPRIQDVRVETEELLSSLFGWSVRTIEAEARPGLLGARWAWFAYRNYLRLYRADAALARVCPTPLLQPAARRPPPGGLTRGRGGRGPAGPAAAPGRGLGP